MTLLGDLEAALPGAARGDAFDFEGWALRVFRHQYEHNEPYRAYCERRGDAPDTVETWDTVPPVPTAAFRHTDLVCGPAEATFETTGTTGGPAARGRHLVPTLSLYRTAALTAFEAHVLPDRARLRVLCLLPPPDVAPVSSLVAMCAWVGEAFGIDTTWFWRNDTLDVDALVTALREHESHGDQLLLLGPTASYERLFDGGQRFRLGPASRVMDTGGSKGMRRPLSRPGFLRTCWERLGVAGYYCIGEYGMTELCSQRYESVLADRLAGNSLAPRRLVAPPWLRTRVVDPDTIEPVPEGATGLLCHHDLANAGSVSVVLTSDLGHTFEDGIVVTGRAPGATPRGCGQLLGTVPE